MLAFNLGVFFHNLAGAEVEFIATNARCDLHFVGSVALMREEEDVARQLEVTLQRGEVRCRIIIPEEDALESPDEPQVEVRLEQHTAAGLVELLHTRFRFENISLKPLAAKPEEGEAPEDVQGKPEPPKAG